MLKPYNVLIKARVLLDKDSKKMDPDQFVEDTAIFYSKNLLGWKLLEVEVYNIKESDKQADFKESDFKESDFKESNLVSSFKILAEKSTK